MSTAPGPTPRDESPGVGPARDDEVDALADLAARTFPDACPPELPEHAIRSFVRQHLSAEAFRGYLADPEHSVRVLRAADGRCAATHCSSTAWRWTPGAPVSSPAVRPPG